MANQHYTHESATYDGGIRLSGIPITMAEGAAMLKDKGVYPTFDIALAVLRSGSSPMVSGDPRGIHRRIQAKR